MNTMKTKSLRCPHCKNADTGKMESNGEARNSRDLTMLCVARVAPSDWSFDESPTEDLVGPDGLVPCGMQWDPNE